MRQESISNDQSGKMKHVKQYSGELGMNGESEGGKVDETSLERLSKVKDNHDFPVYCVMEVEWSGVE